MPSRGGNCQLGDFAKNAMEVLMPSRGGNCQLGDFAKNASDHANLWPSTCVSILKRPLMDSDERKLIERVRAGDLAAFKDFVESYQRPVFNFAMQLTGDWDDADDISSRYLSKPTVVWAASGGTLRL